jgi:hypothetical protein
MGRARVMARQLSEQLEREVNAEELLKEQSTPNPPAANRIAPTAPYAPSTTAYAPPTAPYAPPEAGHEAGIDPHAARHAEYEPPTTVTVPTTTPSND